MQLHFTDNPDTRQQVNTMIRQLILQTNAPCLHISFTKVELIRDLHIHLLGTLNYEKVFYRFIAFGLLGLLLYPGRNHIKCLLSK